LASLPIYSFQLFSFCFFSFCFSFFILQNKKKAEGVGASAGRPHILCEAQNVMPTVARREERSDEACDTPRAASIVGSEGTNNAMLNQFKDKRGKIKNKKKWRK